MTPAKLRSYLESMRQVVEFSDGEPIIKKGIDGVLVSVRTRTVNRQYVNGKLHGPSVDYYGTTLYFWNGVHVPAKFWVHPERVTLDDVFKQSNAEQRRACLEMYGLDKVEQYEGYELVHEDEVTGARLFKIKLHDDFHPICYLRVINSTPEPDGTRKVYHLCVPAEEEFKTCNDALKWTFKVDKYEPVVET